MRLRLLSEDVVPGLRPSRGLTRRRWDVTGHLSPSGSSLKVKSTNLRRFSGPSGILWNSLHFSTVGATVVGIPSDQRPTILALKCSRASATDDIPVCAAYTLAVC